MKQSSLKVCNELIESLKQAEGATSQLIHMSGRPMQFVGLRDVLALTVEMCLSIAPHNAILAPKVTIVK